jgi:F0F1-type ATP synthase assembly protein I
VDLQAKRETYKGFGNAYNRAFEMVVGPVLFGLLGWVVDGFAGTSPVFAVALGGFGFVGVMAKAYLRYVAEMKAHDERMFGTTP